MPPKKHAAPLADPEELQQFIDTLKNLTDYSKFIKSRWLKMVTWLHNRSMEA